MAGCSYSHECILMSYGIKPIIFEGTMKKKLHYAIQLWDKDEQAVARVIRQCIEANNVPYLPLSLRFVM